MNTWIGRWCTKLSASKWCYSRLSCTSRDSIPVLFCGSTVRQNSLVHRAAVGGETLSSASSFGLCFLFPGSFSRFIVLTKMLITGGGHGSRFGWAWGFLREQVNTVFVFITQDSFGDELVGCSAWLMDWDVSIAASPVLQAEEKR